MNPELVAKARQRVEEPKVVETATGRLVHVPTVLNLPEASRLARDGYPAILTAGPTRDELSWSIDCMHVEEFLDVESNVPGGPNAEALERAIDFGARCDGPLVIHCHAGISRSTATAIAVLIARGVSPEVAEQLTIDARYEGYLTRQRGDIAAYRRDEALSLPSDLDYGAIGSLSTEVRQKLEANRPATLGQAARISGVTPAALVALLKHVRRRAA